MISRRKTLSTLSKGFFASAAIVVSLVPSMAQLGSLKIEADWINRNNTPEDERNFVKAMEDWERRSKPATGALVVGRFRDAYWYVARTIEWAPKPGQRLPLVKVPVGFVTDFASIPRALWSMLPRDGDYVWAAVVHDYLYWNQETTKEQADDVFNAAMIELEIPIAERVAIYKAVQVAGQTSWQGNAKLKAAGEKRLIKLFPSDPTTYWSDWKKRPDVF